MNWNILVVGAGVSGATLAERYAEMGKKVLVLEKRNHIGGNCYDYEDEEGVLISKYGPHIFHTNDREVWEYVNRFSEWYPWEHKELVKINNQLVPIPINITAVNRIFNLHLANEEEMRNWLKINRVPIDSPKNGKEVLLDVMGEMLSNKIFKYYSKKKWGKYPEELNPEMFHDITVRTNYEDRYYLDKYQALPKNGYTKIFENMLNHPNIEVHLDTNYFDIINSLPSFEKVFYTGRIDQFFNFRHSHKVELEYHSLRFEIQRLDKEYFQNNSIISYPNPEVEYIRIVEYKHFGNQMAHATTIVKEYPSDKGKPFYPVLDKRNLKLYKLFRTKAQKCTEIYFIGGLTRFQYVEMDQSFKDALNLFYHLEQNNLLRYRAFGS